MSANTGALVGGAYLHSGLTDTFHAFTLARVFSPSLTSVFSRAQHAHKETFPQRGVIYWTWLMPHVKLQSEKSSIVQMRCHLVSTLNLHA